MPERVPPTARVSAILAGDRRAIARAISAIEQDAPGAPAVVRALAPHVGHAHVLGITGAPGAGKSTLINALLGELLARDRRIAVVAVDPSSPFSGGAVLGDRVRMGDHGAHANVFIRSVASRGHLGGVSRTTAEIVDVLDAAGFDTIIVETVGAGQSEVEIARLADTRLVVCPPGLGDNVQAIKAGILEIADLLVVSKGELPAAEAAVRDLEEMLRLRRTGAPAIPVLKVAAMQGTGIAAVADAVQAHAARAGCGCRLAARAPRAGGTPARPARREAAHGGMPHASASGVTLADGDATTAATTQAASRVARLAARDPFVGTLGIRCTDAGPGRATVALTVGDAHINFNGTCHGGVIFALADTAFGLASNSHGSIAAGIDAHITYHVAAQRGDTLHASAVEISRLRRIAVYRIDVARADATLIASFTGTVYVTTRPNEPGGAHR